MAPNMSPTDWATLVLQDLGAPISANNMQFMEQWMLSENSTSNWAPRNNPLNNGLGSGGGAGLGSYPDLATAAKDVADNLKDGNASYGYGAVVQNLMASAPPSETAQAIVSSSWAGGHYNNGANWAGGPVSYSGSTASTPQQTAAPPPTSARRASPSTGPRTPPKPGWTPRRGRTRPPRSARWQPRCRPTASPARTSRTSSASPGTPSPPTRTRPRSPSTSRRRGPRPIPPSRSSSPASPQPTRPARRTASRP